MAENYPDVFEDILDIHPLQVDLDITPENMATPVPESTISQEIRELLSITIDPKLQFKSEDNSIQQLEILFPTFVRASQFSNSQVTRRYTGKSTLEPVRAMISIYLLTPSMDKTYFAGFFMTGYDKNGVRNPNYIHRLITQCRNKCMDDAFLADMIKANYPISITQCELGYLIYDTQTRNIILNKFTKQMTASEWHHQPNPSVTFNNDENHTATFHVVFYVQFNKLQPQTEKSHKSISTINNSAMNIIIDDINKYSGQINSGLNEHEQLKNEILPSPTVKQDSSEKPERVTTKKRLGPPQERQFSNRTSSSPDRRAYRSRSPERRVQYH